MNATTGTSLRSVIVMVAAEHIMGARATCTCGENFDRFGWRELYGQHVADSVADHPDYREEWKP